MAQDIKALKDAGKKVIIVSSGAVALGRTSLGIPLDTPPAQIPLEKKQACSAVGQFHVFNAFHKAFHAFDIKIAQVLLTMSETENRKMYLNARATMDELLKADIIPVINENDTISTEEIRFGDNDRLAVRVGIMMEADTVVLLSTTDGLYTADPSTDENAEHIPLIANIDETHTKMAGEAVPGMSTGGMKSKVEAAKNANMSGIHLIIAYGRDLHALKSLAGDETIRSSLFLAANAHKNARKRWIASHMKPKGKIFIDEGAAQAIHDGKSLLPVGVKDIHGKFERGDIVQVMDEAGNHLATGVSAYSAKDAQIIKGLQKGRVHAVHGYMGRDELIHRNDLVLVNRAP